MALSLVCGVHYKKGMKTLNLKKGKTLKRCNALPLVWAAIAGCTGEKTNRWRYGVGHFGRTDVEYFCAACEAFTAQSEALRGDAHQSFLAEAQRSAGVENYRYARVKRVNDKPTIVK